MQSRAFPLIATLGALFTLSGCGVADRVGAIGKPPRLSEPQFVVPPAPLAAAAPVYAAPAPAVSAVQGASLYRAGAPGLFRDHRASGVGDLLTIAINVDDKAEFDNSTSRNRTGSEEGGVGALFGLEKVVKSLIGLDTANMVGAESSSVSKGTGNSARSETLSLKMAAVVTHVLPNGNMVIRGSQETRLNNELRELTLVGLIRPVDIAPDNSIAHHKIAEARFSYGGKGQLTDAQQARWGQQLIDAISPF